MNILLGSDEDPALWWHWSCRDPQGRGWRNGQAWLNWRSNGISVQWVLFPKVLGASLEFDAFGDDAICGHIRLPWLVALYWTLDRAKWIEWLPGMKPKSVYGDGHREIGFFWDFYEQLIHWRLWRNPTISDSRDWRDGGVFVLDVLLGRTKFSRVVHDTYNTFLEMPEGAYACEVAITTSTWKRRHVPWAQVKRGATVTIPNGVPIENRRGDDDAIFKLSILDEVTVDGVLQAVKARVMEKRPDGWKPSSLDRALTVQGRGGA